MGIMLEFFVVGFFGFACFVIYFIFKLLEFVITAVNLYRKIITRQDTMIKLLIDIRDGTKQLDPYKIPETEASDDETSAESNVVGTAFCSNCYKFVQVRATNPGKCASCGKAIA